MTAPAIRPEFHSPWTVTAPAAEAKPVLGLLMAAETLLKLGVCPDVRAAIREQLCIQDNRRADNG